MNLKRRNEIIDAAIELLAEGGLSNLSLKQIAAKVGFKDAAIYRHFESKEEILKAIIDRLEEGSLGVLSEVNALKNKTELEKIAFFFINRADFFSQHPQIAGIMFSNELFFINELYLARIFSLLKSHEILLVGLINEAQKKGQIRKDIEAEHIFLMIIGSLRLLISRWLSSKKSFELRQAAGRLWQSLEKVIRRKNYE